MNVHVLDTPVQLPKPDMEIVIGSREKLKRQANALGDIYLPVMKETLRSLLDGKRLMNPTFPTSN